MSNMLQREDNPLIRVQREDFDVGAELAAIRKDNHNIGGVCAFVGLVRDMAGDTPIDSMTLEHYPAMTEKSLAAIEAEAHRRWPLNASLIIHRYGRLKAGDQIVLGVTACAHRQAAFASCNFIMDWLKTKAPFWKLEERGDNTRWVEAKDFDNDAMAKWEKDNL